MNKAELIDAISGRVGDRRTASTAVEALLATVQRTVQRGERVTLSGFGVFEKVDRAARTARNPATGEAVHLAATSVPRFRPGQAFKDVISGARPVEEEPTEPAPAPRATRTRPAAAPARRGTALTSGVPVRGAEADAPEVQPETAGTAAASPAPPAPRARASRPAPSAVAAPPAPTTAAPAGKAAGTAGKAAGTAGKAAGTAGKAAGTAGKADSKKAKKDDKKDDGKKESAKKSGKGEGKKGKKR